MVKKPPAHAGDIRDLGSIPQLGRSLKEGTTTHSSILAWRIPWTEEPVRVHGVSKNWTQLRWRDTLTPSIYWQDLNIQLRPTSPPCSWFIYPPAIDFPFESLTRHLKFSSTYTKLNSWSSHNQIYSFNRLPHAVVQLLSHVWHIVIPWTAARQVSLSFTISQCLLKLMSLESVMPSNHLILCCPLLLPSIFPSISIKVFSNELALFIRWPKYWSFNFSISPFNKYWGLSSFRIDWFDLLAVQVLSRVFSNIKIWKHRFFGAQPSLWSNAEDLGLIPWLGKFP